MTDNDLHFDAQHHPDIDLLSDYVSGSDSPEMRSAIAAHLATCEVCRENVRALQGTVALLRGLPQFAPPKSFQLGPEFATRQRSGGGVPTEPSRIVRLLPLVRTLSVAAVLLFLVIGGATFIDNRDHGDSLDRAAIAPTSVTEQVSGALQESGKSSDSESEAPPQANEPPPQAAVVDRGDSASARIDNPVPATSGQDAESTPTGGSVGQGATVSSESVDDSSNDGFPWLSTTIGLGALAVILVGLWLVLARVSRQR